jgi:hypothetical protein
VVPSGWQPHPQYAAKAGKAPGRTQEKMRHEGGSAEASWQPTPLGAGELSASKRTVPRGDVVQPHRVPSAVPIVRCSVARRATEVIRYRAETSAAPLAG